MSLHKHFQEIDDVSQGDAFNKIIKERHLNAIFPQGESLIRNVQGGNGVKITHASVATPTCTQTKRV